MTKIIAFNGGYGSGKSTAIRTFKDMHLEKDVRLVKFAGPLYEIQEFAYRRIQTAYQRPEGFIKDRKLLQWLGTEWGRELNQSLWVNLWTAEAESHKAAGRIVLCDDCRFDNEAETVRALGGVVIQIVRPDNGVHAEGGTGIQNHKSEAGVSPHLVDRVITNDGTLAAFENKLSQLFAELTLNRAESA